MKVHGVEISENAIAAVIAKMKAGEFQARQLVEVAPPLLVDVNIDRRYRDEIAHRAVDRIIQQERRAKNIRITTYPRWNWCGAA